MKGIAVSNWNGNEISLLPFLKAFLCVSNVNYNLRRGIIPTKYIV